MATITLLHINTPVECFLTPRPFSWSAITTWLLGPDICGEFSLLTWLIQNLISGFPEAESIDVMKH